MLGRGHGERDLRTDFGVCHVCRRKAGGLSEVHDLDCPEADATNALARRLPACEIWSAEADGDPVSQTQVRMERYKELADGVERVVPPDGHWTLY